METTPNNTVSKIILGTQKTESLSVIKFQPWDVFAEPFPTHRVIKWIPRTASSSPLEITLVVTQNVLKEVCQHVAADLTREYGGFFFGNRYQCPISGIEYVLIDDYYKAEFTEGTSIQLAFTTDTWADLTDKRFTRFRGKLLVGWYHSHPKMDIFLSQDDVEVHQARFPEPWSCALVLEPEKGLGGFFVSQDGKLNCTSPVEFYEFCDHKAAGSVLHWPNYSREEKDCAVEPERPATPEATSAVIENRAAHEIVEMNVPSDEMTSDVEPLLLPLPSAWKAASAGVLLILLAVVGVVWLQNQFAPESLPAANKTEVVQVIAPTPKASSSPAEIVPAPEQVDQAISEAKVTVDAAPVETPAEKAASLAGTPERLTRLRNKVREASARQPKKHERTNGKKKGETPPPQSTVIPPTPTVKIEPDPEKKPVTEGKPDPASQPANDKGKSENKGNEKPHEEAVPPGKKGKTTDA